MPVLPSVTLSEALNFRESAGIASGPRPNGLGWSHAAPAAQAARCKNSRRFIRPPLKPRIADPPYPTLDARKNPPVSRSPVSPRKEKAKNCKIRPPFLSYLLLSSARTPGMISSRCSRCKMKMTRPASTKLATRVGRRKFLEQSAGTALAFSILPRHVLGGPGFVPPSDKVNIAFIGVGAQGLRVMLHFLKEPDVQAVAVCDPNKASADYPQWDTHEFCKSIRELLGVDTGWDWLSPDQPIQLSHTLRVTSGVAGREPSQQIVNALYASRQTSGKYNGCAAYSDYRELLEKQKDADAVVVCTTDHLHAVISAAAMKKRKHVFCQKPLTHTIFEARQIAEIAHQTGVATQIAVGNQASEATRLLCEWIWDGAIGPVREVHNWSSRPFWPQAVERPKETQPVPEGLDWELWLGPSPERPFHHAYLPFVWRGWSDFGCGALGG